MNKQIKKQIYTILILVLLLTQIQSSDNPFYTGPDGKPREQEGKVWFEAFKKQELEKQKNQSSSTANKLPESFSPKTIHNAEASFAVFKRFFDLF